MKIRSLACLMLVLLLGHCCLADTAAAARETGSIDDPVKMNVSYVFPAEIYTDGTARTVADGTDYRKIEVTITLIDYLKPDYYRDVYGRTYELKGNEACCVIDATLNSSAAGSIILQNSVLIQMCDRDGNVSPGYQLIDREIGGSAKVALEPGRTVRLYKRYDYQEGDALSLMSVTYYVDGASHTVYFSLAKAYRPIGRDLENDQQDVMKLQLRLIELGYLNDAADGMFGKKTEKAVMKAQKAFGLQETGIADEELQTLLYGKQ